MSKRFGRQQKRKLKAEIADLNKQLTFIQRDTESTVTAARQIIKAVRDVCPHSVFLERAQVSPWHYRLNEPILTSAVIQDHEHPDKLIDIRLIDLYDLEVLFNQEPFDRMVHFDVVFSDEAAVHARAVHRISKEALVYTPIDMIVRSLVERIRKEMRSRGDL